MGLQRFLQTQIPRNTILGDLVVDTSGRESKTSEWLDQLGYGKPEETTVNSYIGYSTCWFRANYTANLW